MLNCVHNNNEKKLFLFHIFMSSSNLNSSIEMILLILDMSDQLGFCDPVFGWTLEYADWKTVL